MQEEEQLIAMLREEKVPDEQIATLTRFFRQERPCHRHINKQRVLTVLLNTENLLYDCNSIVEDIVEQETEEAEKLLLEAKILKTQVHRATKSVSGKDPGGIKQKVARQLAALRQ